MTLFKPPARWVLFVALFLGLSALCSLPRFGQRENEHVPRLSDSDLYLEMARVFTGDANQFSAGWLAERPHHYNRPLFSFLAGYLGKYVLGGNLRAAFSLINILAATTIALLLMRCIQEHRPTWQMAWLPSVLFLTAFPQLNWGYHILTDTLGLATAFATTAYAAWLVERVGAAGRPAIKTVHLLLLWFASSLSFLTRETGWMAPVATGWLLFARRSHLAPHRLAALLILGLLLLGKLPHSLYARCYEVTGVPLRSSFGSLFDIRYIFDFLVKSGVCFHLAWVLAAVGFFRRRRDSNPLPPMLVGWMIGGLLYLSAGYFVNNIASIGYPMRMTFVLFPLVYYHAAEFFERMPPQRRRASALAFCAVHAAIGLLGVWLDPGHAAITAGGLLKSLGEQLGR